MANLPAHGNKLNFGFPVEIVYRNSKKEDLITSDSAFV